MLAPRSVIIDNRPHDRERDRCHRTAPVCINSGAWHLSQRALLVTETFIAHLGAVESFTRTADRQVSGGVKSLVEIGGARGTQEQVAYHLTNPLTQALVLHSALASEGQVQQPSSFTTVGTFVEAVGSVYFPGRPELMQSPPADLDGTALIVVAECDRQSQVARAFGMADTQFLATAPR